MDISKASKRDRKIKKRTHGMEVDNRSIFTIKDAEKKRAERIKRERLEKEKLRNGES